MQAGIDAVVVPMGVKPEDYAAFLPAPVQAHQHPRRARDHAAQGHDGGPARRGHARPCKVAGSCNAILRRPDGSLLGDMFDGAGFTRGVERNGRPIAGTRALVVGSGGVGCAIAASLAAAGLAASASTMRTPPQRRRWPPGCGSTTPCWR